MPVTAERPRLVPVMTARALDEDAVNQDEYHRQQRNILSLKY
jgi:hypothetical protein